METVANQNIVNTTQKLHLKCQLDAQLLSAVISFGKLKAPLNNIKIISRQFIISHDVAIIRNQIVPELNSHIKKIELKKSKEPMEL
jgi:hypothetical protein